MPGLFRLSVTKRRAMIMAVAASIALAMGALLSARGPVADPEKVTHFFRGLARLEASMQHLKLTAGDVDVAATEVLVHEMICEMVGENGISSPAAPELASAWAALRHGAKDGEPSRFVEARKHATQALVKGGEQLPGREGVEALATFMASTTALDANVDLLRRDLLSLLQTEGMPISVTEALVAVDNSLTTAMSQPTPMKSFYDVRAQIDRVVALADLQLTDVLQRRTSNSWALVFFAVAMLFGIPALFLLARVEPATPFDHGHVAEAVCEGVGVVASNLEHLLDDLETIGQVARENRIKEVGESAADHISNVRGGLMEMRQRLLGMANAARLISEASTIPQRPG